MCDVGDQLQAEKKRLKVPEEGNTIGTPFPTCITPISYMFKPLYLGGGD